MAYSGLLTDYLGEGLAAARPATPNLSPGACGIYYATDTGATSIWDGSTWHTVGGASGVTSVGLTLPSSILTVSGSPVTSTGTLTGALATQTANEVWAGPTSGSAAAPTFRAIVPADLPVATTSALGAVQPDGTTITISAGVISSSGGGAPAAVTLVQSAAFTGITAPTMTLGSTPTAGNMLLFIATRFASVISLTAGWTQLFNGTGSVDIPLIAYKFAGPSESATQTAYTTTTGWSAVLLEISGATLANIQQFGGSTNTSTVVSIPAGFATNNSTIFGIINANDRATPDTVVSLTGATSISVTSNSSTTVGGARTAQAFSQVVSVKGGNTTICTFGVSDPNCWAYVIFNSAV